MGKTKHAITVQEAERIESRSLLAALAALLCLFFAVSFFINGPGSDGGSGLGGTGKFGGESGFGGTGKTPNNGPGFKLGASSDEDRRQDLITPDNNGIEAVDPQPVELLTGMDIYQDSIGSAPVFDVTALKLTPETMPSSMTPPVRDSSRDISLEFDRYVSEVELDGNRDVDRILDSEADVIANYLVSSQDILAGLMVAEAQTSLLAEEQLQNNRPLELTDAGEKIRNRVVIPSRPERPDRFTAPARITPVERINVPTPPPVRPMRTLSTLVQ